MQKVISPYWDDIVCADYFVINCRTGDVPILINNVHYIQNHTKSKTYGSRLVFITDKQASHVSCGDNDDIYGRIATITTELNLICFKMDKKIGPTDLFHVVCKLLDIPNIRKHKILERITLYKCDDGITISYLERIDADLMGKL
jgi:hypothetical protein